MYKKVLAKTVLPIEKYIFEIDIKRQIFWYPIRPIQRKKVFI
jgi:hypothetical protein